MSNSFRLLKVFVLQKKTTTSMNSTRVSRFKNIALSLTICLSAPSAFAGAGTSDQINWMPYDSALVKAKKENKHVLIHFTTTWCGWCKKMIAETYTNPTIKKQVRDEFVTARVDGDSYNVLKLTDGDITEKGLTLQYGVRSYPTTFFLEPNGNKIAGAPGYLDTLKMHYVLGFISGNFNEDMAFTDYLMQQQKLDSARPEARIQLGMTSKDVRTSWGAPARVEPKPSDKGKVEEWLYGTNQYLIFRDGKLRGFQERAATANDGKMKATTP
jgi:thioredoxin-related protein